MSWKSISDLPAGITPSLRTVSEEDALIGVIIGAPFYSPTSEMHGVTR
ncbi:hypothetical protein [Arthrobacter sp. D1-17]